jgi:ParB-like chromosome segregation protein Spo0J
MAIDDSGNTQEQFQYIPIDSIIVRTQIRTAIDVNSESNKALQASVSLYGVQQPIRVMKNEEDTGTYILICGERRLLAAKAIGLTTIPAIIMDPVTQKAEIDALQLTENMQREDLDAIDMANGILDYLHETHGDSNYWVDGALGYMTNYLRRPEDVPDNIAVRLTAISQISGNSIRTLHRRLSILKLGKEIQEAIRTETIPLTQGYALAANRDNPAFNKACTLALTGETTVKELEKLFASAKAVVTQKKPPAANFTRQCQALQSWGTIIQKDAAKYGQEELQRLRDELKTLADLLDAQLAGTAKG